MATNTLTDADSVSRRLIAQMLAEGSSGAPIQHWTQGLNRLAQGLVGGMNLSALRGREMEAKAAERAKEEADRAATERATSNAIGALYPQGAAVQPPAPQAGSPVAAALGSPQAAINDRFGSWDTVDIPTKAQPGIVAALGGQTPAPAGGGMFGGMPGFAPGERPVGWPEPPVATPKTGSVPTAQALAQSTIPQTAPQPMPQAAPPQQPELDRARMLQILGDPRAPKELKDLALSHLKPNKPLVTINQGGESSEFRKAADRGIAKRFEDYIEAGDKAVSAKADLEFLRELGTKIATGKTAEVMAMIGPYARALGIPIEGLGYMEAYNAVVSRVVPNLRVPGSGTTSDRDLAMYLQSYAGLGRTPEGNAIILNTNEALLNHRMAIADIASRALREEITSREAERMIRALPDPLEMWKKSRGASPVEVPSRDYLRKKYRLE